MLAVKHILLPFLFFISNPLFSQTPPELLAREVRLLFYPLPDNVNIKSAGVKTEKIYAHFSAIANGSDSNLLEERSYNEEGYLTRKIDHSTHGIEDRFSYDFYQSGLIKTLKVERYLNDSLVHAEAVTYNERGNELSHTIYDYNYNKIISRLKEYNSKDQCIYLWDLNNNNEYQLAKAYHYNPGGSLKRVELFARNSRTPYKSYSYSLKNNLEKVSLTLSNTTTDEAIFKYNEKGDCIEATRLSLKTFPSRPTPVDEDVLVVVNSNSSNPMAAVESFSVDRSALTSNLGSLSQVAGKYMDAELIPLGNSTITVRDNSTSKGTMVSNVSSKIYYNEKGLITGEYISNDLTGLLLATKNIYAH